MFTQILRSLNSIVSLNKIEEEAFINILETKQFKKKEFLLKEGQICDKISFINSGCMRLFNDVDAVEKTIQFFFANSFHTDFSSFLTGKPTVENMQAIEDSEVLVFKKNDLYALYESHPVFERAGRMLTESAFLSISRLNSMFNETPEQRYLNLFEQRPEIVEKIPQHYIASYLGIQPESLSRIRKRILSSK
jgi:CRP/FNR family transcriptional regulator, anaerobic regulatory protein